jgi:hypothetical protein
MFWISYFVTLVLAAAIGIALMAIRLVLSVVGVFRSIRPLNQGNAASRWRVRSPRNHRWSLPIRRAD